MQGQAIEKIKGGKLLNIKVDYSDKIHNVQIVGDFFAHPEDSIQKIEEKIKGMDVDFDHEILTNDLKAFVKENNYDLIGIHPEAIVKLLKKSLEAKS